MVVVPGDTPVTIPESEPTVISVPLPGNQHPPGAPSLIATVPPTHTIPGPVIGVGDTLTVTVFVIRQPVGSV